MRELVCTSKNLERGRRKLYSFLCTFDFDTPADSFNTEPTCGTRKPALNRRPVGFSPKPPSSLTRLNSQPQPRAGNKPQLLPGANMGTNPVPGATLRLSPALPPPLGPIGFLWPPVLKKIYLSDPFSFFPTTSISYILIPLTCKIDYDIIIT